MQAQDNVDNAVLHISRAGSMPTHFENLFQSALNLGQRYRTFKKNSKCVAKVHQQTSL